jgi:PAS domain-containing protein
LRMVVGYEIALVLCSVLFSSGALCTLIVFRKVALQTVATASTVCFAVNLCVGVLVAAYGNGERLNLFVYLLWFFPLLTFNKLVNQPAVGRLLARILFIAPMFLIACLVRRVMTVLKPEQLVFLGVFCLSYCCFALTLNIVTRYREKYIIEREHAESLRLEAEVLESISDCFISLDSSFRLIYLNDAACEAFAVDRRAAMNDNLSRAVPRFFSRSMMAGLHAASTRDIATIFEAENEERRLWYDLRCFPRPDGMSIYFRDITDRKRDEARIQYLAFYDVLTALPNRQLLQDRLNAALEANPGQESLGALLYID